MMGGGKDVSRSYRDQRKEILMIKTSVGIWAFGPTVTRFVPFVRDLAREIDRDTLREARRRRKEARASGNEA